MRGFRLTANRVAAAVTVIGGLAAFVAGIAQVLPGAWPNYALAASGLLVKAVTVLKFMDGSQKWDALVAQAAPTIGSFPSVWESPGVVATNAPDEPPPLNVTPIPPPGEPA